ncbi:hypothetical protein TrVE_jg7079 [Triparma verrucosa]|uniref:HAD family hydrolase n=1 Tax=Triparma verrucosa TaxID=1606542 RepID=A0A9W7FDI5_9STRA|nr:hypothetical protein TrVE_jg7079 [Triparma verrucosa]
MFTGSNLRIISAAPRIIVLDKDGTLGDARYGLQNWVETMTVKIINHFEQADIFPSMLKKDVTRKFHQLAGWDSERRSITGAASMLAGATWSDILEATADLLSLPLPTVMAWHESIGPLHGNDKPVNDLQLDELIKKLKSMGLIVCVCTSDSRASAEMALKNWKIFDLLDDVITSDDLTVDQSKPSPYPLRMLCEKFDVPVESAIVAGDTAGDTLMGRNAAAGITIGVLSGSGLPADLLENGADILLPDVSFIPDFIAQISSNKKRPASPPGEKYERRIFRKVSAAA